MIPARRLVWAALLCFCAAPCLAHPPASLTTEQQAWLAKAKRFERAGWIYLHIEGEPGERGFQHGYLLAKQIAERGLRVTRIESQHESSMDWPWLVARAATMFVPRVDPEDMAELEGITAGAQAAGVSVSRDELIAYNGIIELNDYWWPTEMKKIKDSPMLPVRESCSSFVATGA